MNNYHICEIGRSKNSVVYKGRLKKTIEYLAIKSCEKAHKLKVMNEVRILQNLDQENIVKYHAWHKTRNHLWLVLEYCPGGDILTLIDQDKSLPEKVIKDFGLNIMDGLYYLHSKGIIYADLKPSNILFNEYGVLKLCDFGLAQLISDSQSEENKKGTPYYMAPELFEEGGVYSYYSDLWSFGCVLYELYVGTPPFISSTFKDLKEQILTAETPSIPNASGNFNDLIAGLLQKDPSKRMNWEELLWHEFWEGQRMHQQIKLPRHETYENYLKARGVQQRTSDRLRENRKYEARDSIRASLNGKEDFVLKSRDQVLNLGENWDIDDHAEEAKIVHQRSNSATLQTPVVKNTFKPQPVEQLIIHNTDINVKPIICSHENLMNCFDHDMSKWTAENINDHVNSPELENHLSDVYSVLNTSVPISKKLSYLAYIESLIQDFPLANKLINSAFVQLFLKIMISYGKNNEITEADRKQKLSSQLRARICSIFGQMIRHATMIDSDLPASNVVEAFMDIISEENQNSPASDNLLKKKALAALGEYLFYAATQMDEEEYDDAWLIDPKMSDFLTGEILDSQDEQCKLLAVRTVENITAQSKNGGTIFASTQMAISLTRTFIDSVCEELKFSSIAALSHIVRLCPKVFKDFSNCLTMKVFYQYLKDADERTQQALITILCYALQSREGVEINFNVLSNMMESPGIVIRGKCLLCFMFLLKNNGSYLGDMAKSKFFMQVDRLLKDSYKYVQCCLHHFLDTLTDKVMQAVRMAVEGSYGLFNVLPAIFNSSCGRLKLPVPNFIKCISSLLLKDVPDSNQVILEILESMASKSKQFKAFSDIIIINLLPNLLETLNRNIDTRFRCLKIFTDFMISFLFDEEVYDPVNTSKYTTKMMNELIVKRLLPLYPELLKDTEPVPLICIKLLSCILERCQEYVAVVKSHGLVGHFLAHFKAADQKLSMHLLEIVKKFVSSGELTIDELLEYNIVEQLNSVINYVVDQDWCVEITLDILYSLLVSLSSKYRDKLNPAIYPLSGNLVVCTKLLQSDDESVTENSMHCLMLILQLFGGYLTQNSNREQKDALLQIVTYNNSGLQKVCIKILKGLVDSSNAPGSFDG